MKVLALLLLAISPTLSLASASSCARLDASLVHCPAPTAPPVTELTDGEVVVRLSVRPDGSVAAASLVSSAGHRAWAAAALVAVRDWRFAPSAHGFSKDLTLAFKVGGTPPPHAASAPQPSDVQGSWSCGPYEMNNDGIAIVATDRRVFSPDGSFEGLGSATYTLPDGTQVRVEARHTGRWTLVGDVIEITYSTAEFLSSDNPLFTVEAGQAALDAQIRRKGWTKKRILAFGPTLVTVTVEASDKQAEVQVSCTRT